MSFDKHKVALALQIAYPALIVLFNVITFPSTYAEAQRSMGPPYYLPYEVLSGLLCTLLFFTAFLLWRQYLAGWLLSILLDGAVSISLVYFVLFDRLGKWPMPVGVDSALLATAALFTVIPILLVSRQSLAFFRIVPPIDNQTIASFHQLK